MNLKDAKDKLQEYGNQLLPIAIAAAMGSGITYYVCNRQYEEQLSELEDQVASLNEKQRTAIVTQRISEQMEDIAYQQKEISDKQRERAEEQSRIADIERGKAEYERGMAQQAEHRALKAAEEADSMRLVAEEQTQVATENMLAAELARAEADTLFYLSLSRNLAQASLRESAGGASTPLSRLLSYAAWHYSETYGGNIYHQDLYHSLVRSSGLLSSYGSLPKGNPRFVKSMDIDGNNVILIVTDYGEMLFNYSGKLRMIQTEKRNFRDATTKGSKVYALTGEGLIVRTDFSDYINGNHAIEESTFPQLPNGVWNHIVKTADGKQLVAISDRQVAWANIDSENIAEVKNLPQNPCAIGEANGTIHIFCADGSHFTSTKQGELLPQNLSSVNGEVTAFYHNPKNGLTFLGTRDGSINILDADLIPLRILTGHTSSIIQMSMFDNMLVSSSYDKTLKIWDIQDIDGIIMPFEQKIDFWPLAFDIEKSTYTLWLGTANGYILNFCVDMKRNANANRQLLEREFTDEEWNYYIGKSVPKQQFMINKENAK